MSLNTGSERKYFLFSSAYVQHQTSPSMHSLSIGNSLGYWKAKHLALLVLLCFHAVGHIRERKILYELPILSLFLSLLDFEHISFCRALGRAPWATGVPQTQTENYSIKQRQFSLIIYGNQLTTIPCSPIQLQPFQCCAALWVVKEVSLAEKLLGNHL